MGLKMDRSRLWGALVLSGLSAGVVAAPASTTKTLTTADYARAEKMISYSTVPLVDHAVGAVTWLDDTHFWYRDHDAQGDHYKVMDASGKVEPAFD